jgi:hypothetical protein
MFEQPSDCLQRSLFSGAPEHGPISRTSRVDGQAGLG